MKNAEIFYRLKYPKVDKLSHMDNEIIGLLEGYEQHINQGQSLPIDIVMTCDMCESTDKVGYDLFLSMELCSECRKRSKS
jgi:hypothetical protein